MDQEFDDPNVYCDEGLGQTIIPLHEYNFEKTLVIYRDGQKHIIQNQSRKNKNYNTLIIDHYPNLEHLNFNKNDYIKALIVYGPQEISISGLIKIISNYPNLEYLSIDLFSTTISKDILLNIKTRCPYLIFLQLGDYRANGYTFNQLLFNQK